MLRIAFATNDGKTVNLHFGGADSLLIYDVSPGEADLIGEATFAKAEQIGESGRSGITGTVNDKVIPKLGFVEGCAAVYAASIGASSVRRLMALGIQPIVVDDGHDIVDLLNEVSLALVHGGLGWVERAKLRLAKAPQAEAQPIGERKTLMQSLDDLE